MISIHEDGTQSLFTSPGIPMSANLKRQHGPSYARINSMIDKAEETAFIEDIDIECLIEDEAKENVCINTTTLKLKCKHHGIDSVTKHFSKNSFYHVQVGTRIVQVNVNILKRATDASVFFLTATLNEKFKGIWGYFKTQAINSNYGNLMQIDVDFYRELIDDLHRYGVQNHPLFETMSLHLAVMDKLRRICEEIQKPMSQESFDFFLEATNFLGRVTHMCRIIHEPDENRNAILRSLCQVLGFLCFLYEKYEQLPFHPHILSLVPQYSMHRQIRDGNYQAMPKATAIAQFLNTPGVYNAASYFSVSQDIRIEQFPDNFQHAFNVAWPVPVEPPPVTPQHNNEAERLITSIIHNPHHSLIRNPPLNVPEIAIACACIDRIISDAPDRTDAITFAISERVRDVIVFLASKKF